MYSIYIINHIFLNIAIHSSHPVLGKVSIENKVEDGSWENVQMAWEQIDVQERPWLPMSGGHAHREKESVPITKLLRYISKITLQLTE